MTAMSRIDRDSPYRRDYEASVERGMERGRMPKTLGGLLRWMAEQWMLELPTALQVVEEPWHGRQERDKDGNPRWPSELVGGSLLGTPKDKDPFRRLMENSPSEVDEDGSYRRPMHAAIDRLSRRKPLMARNLAAVARAGWDWKSVGTRGGWPEEMYADYLTRALVVLWQEYREERMH